MATRVASLYAEIGANTTGLKRGLSDAKTGLTGLQRDINRGAGGLGNLTAAMGKVAVAAGVMGAAMGAAKAVFDMGRQGAELEYTAQKFDRLAKSIGTTGAALKGDLAQATRGMLSNAEMLAGATDMMALGLAKTHEEAVRLTRVTSALGMNMNQLVLTLTNQTTMRFDALGVSVDGFEAKVKKLEATGMSASDAFKEAFLQQAEAQILKVGEAADTSAGKIRGLEAAVKDLGDEFKIALAKDTSDFSTTFTDPIKAIAEYIKLNNELNKAIGSGVIGLDEAAFILRKVELTSFTAADGLDWLTQKTEEHTSALKKQSDALLHTLTLQAQTDAALAGGMASSATTPPITAGAGAATADPGAALKYALGMPLEAEAESYKASIDSIKLKISELQAEAAKLSQLSYLTAEQQAQLAAINTQLGIQRDNMAASAEAHEEATRRIIFDLMLQQAAAMEMDNATRAAFFQMAGEVGAAWGLLGESSSAAWSEISGGLQKAISDGNWAELMRLIFSIGEAANSVSGVYPITFVVTTLTAQPAPFAGATPKAVPSIPTPPGAFNPWDKPTVGGGGGGGGGGATPTVAAPKKSKTQRYLDTASALGSLGAYAAQRIQEETIDPLKEQLAAIESLMGPGHVDITAMGQLVELEKERAEAAKKVAEAEAKITEFQKQQERLNFLQLQVRLLDTIKENKLKAKNILGGLKLGLDADMNEILAAMTRAMEALITQAEASLGINSPSTVFKGIGENVVKGFVQGLSNQQAIRAGAETMAGAAINGVTLGRPYDDRRANQAPVVVNVAVSDKLDVEAVAYRVAQVIKYRTM